MTEHALRQLADSPGIAGHAVAPSRSRFVSMYCRRSLLSTLSLLIAVAPPVHVDAQSLRGSAESVNRMYGHAVQEHLYFYQTAAGLRKAAEQGRLVRLSGSGFELKGVGYPWVKPSTRTFVERLAAQYHAACGATLVVTSAARPSRREPWNSSPRSVHPTGISVDLRKPSGACRTWLRKTLLQLERSGVIEATEEFAPAHFHVAVFPQRYTNYVAQLARRTPPERARRLAYTVRSGDTLWDIASDHDLSVTALKAANHLSTSIIHPGQDLVLPSD